MGLFGKLLEKATGASRKSAPNDFETHYFLGKELGKGAFATVNEVTRKSDSKKFACKIIHKSKAKDEEEAIQTEIAVLQQLHHPHVVGLTDMFQTKTHYYLVMDLAAGGELFERILERGFYTEKDAASVVKQLLLGLVYIHDELGVVHRDLKPENLLFETREETSNLLITDFGLSRLLKDNDFLSTTCGTPHYVAPEILREAGHSFPVDMWALGVITFVLLCGYTPFWGGETNDQNVLYAGIMSGKYDYNDEHWNSVSDAAKDFINNLLIVKPDKRMTAKDALNHPWLQNEQTFDLLPSVRKNFKARGTLKKAILAVKLLNRLQAANSSGSSPKLEVNEEGSS